MAKTLRNGLSMSETDPLNHKWLHFGIQMGQALHQLQKNLLLNQLFSTTIIILYKGIRDVIWNCKCWPSIWRPFDTTLFKDYLKIPYCTGKRLFCAKARMKSMGLGEISQTNDIIIPDPCFANDKTGSTYKPPPINCLPDPYLANDKIGSTSKPPPINCLARCRVQENNKHLSTASYPQKSLFFYQTTFCDVASVIWQVSCHFENRKYFLERKQPNLCRILKKFKEYFDNTTDCTLWPMNFFEKNDEPNKRLSHVLFKFSF